MSGRMTAERGKALDAAARELGAMRTDWRDALSHYELRIDAQFKELNRRFKPTKGNAVKGAAIPSAKEAQEILEVLGKARLKPGKGRAKDLRRVEEALQRALDRLPPQG